MIPAREERPPEEGQQKEPPERLDHDIRRDDVMLQVVKQFMPCLDEMAAVLPAFRPCVLIGSRHLPDEMFRF